MKKILVIAAGVAGYVLGTKAGRERYEQIKQKTSKVWNSGPVQQGREEAGTHAKHAASAAGSKVADAAGTAGAKVVSAVKSDGPEPAADPLATPVADAPEPGGDPVANAAKKSAPRKQAPKKST